MFDLRFLRAERGILSSAASALERLFVPASCAIPERQRGGDHRHLSHGFAAKYTGIDQLRRMKARVGAAWQAAMSDDADRAGSGPRSPAERIPVQCLRHAFAGRRPCPSPAMCWARYRVSASHNDRLALPEELKSPLIRKGSMKRPVNDFIQISIFD